MSIIFVALLIAGDPIALPLLQTSENSTDSTLVYSAILPPQEKSRVEQGILYSTYVNIPHPSFIQFNLATSSSSKQASEVSILAQAAQHDIVITGRRRSVGDPIRAVNVESFAVTQKVDSAFVGPVARAYKKSVPAPIRSGIHNFLYNIREPVVFLNFLLQLKLGKAGETIGRFAINSTIGAVGVIDVAKRKPFRLPRRSNGFANTLGYYGVKNGPFLFLPLVGPTTVRDLFGGAIDRLILPAMVGDPFTSPTYTVPAAILGALDHRSEFDQTLKDLHKNSPDPYAATRAFYLNRRQAEIDCLHGRCQGDSSGMTEPPKSVRPFVPRNLQPEAPVINVPESPRIGTIHRCSIPQFDDVIPLLECNESLCDKYVTGAPGPRTLSDQQYSVASFACDAEP